MRAEDSAPHEFVSKAANLKDIYVSLTSLVGNNLEALTDSYTRGRSHTEILGDGGRWRHHRVY